MKSEAWIIAASLIILFLLVVKVPNCDFPIEEIETHDPVGMDIQETKTALQTGSVTFFTEGLSMYPTIKPGQACGCKTESSYQAGDLISFYVNYDNRLIFVIHRIIEKLPDGSYVTKGDNNLVIDNFTIRDEQIFCKVEEISLLEKIVGDIRW